MKDMNNCSCFASECDDWPIQLVVHGITIPAMSFVALVLEIAVTRQIDKSIPRHLVGDKLQKNNPDLLLAKKRIYLTVRTLVRALAFYSLTKILNFLSPESHIWRYTGNIGFFLCYITLMTSVVTKIVLTFLTLDCVVILTELTILGIFYKKNMDFPNLKLSGSPIFLTIALVISVALNLLSMANECDVCDPKYGYLEVKRTIHGQNGIPHEYEQTTFALSVAVITFETISNGTLFFLSITAFFSAKIILHRYTASRKSQDTLLTCFRIAASAGSLHSFHLSIHYAVTFYQQFKLGNYDGFNVHNGCFCNVLQDWNGLRANHCLLHDLVFYIDQIGICLALLYLLKYLKAN